MILTFSEKKKFLCCINGKMIYSKNFLSEAKTFVHLLGKQTISAMEEIKLFRSNLVINPNFFFLQKNLISLRMRFAWSETNGNVKQKHFPNTAGVATNHSKIFLEFH